MFKDFVDLSTHANEDFEKGGAGRIKADVGDGKARAGQTCGCDNPEGGARNVSGDDEVSSSDFLATCDADGVVIGFHGHSEAVQKAFGVVSVDGRLDHGGRFRGKHAGKKDTAFHLRTRHGHGVGDGAELTSGDVKRSTSRFFTFGFELGTHFGKGGDDATHGAARERFITYEDAVEFLSCEDACEKTHSRAGVSAIEFCFRGL